MLRTIVYHGVLSAVFLLSFVDNASCAEQSAGTTGMSDDSTDVKNARKMFNLGEMLFKRGAYLEAAAAFQRAYDVAPHPAALANVGFSYEYAGDHVRAIATYRAYLSMNAVRDADTEAEVRNRLATLKLLVGELHVICIPGDCIIEVDGVQKGRTVDGRIVILMAPGNYTVTARGADEQLVSSTYPVEPGAVTNVRFSVSEAHERLPSVEPAPGVTLSSVWEEQRRSAAQENIPTDALSGAAPSVGWRVSYYSLLSAAIASGMLTAMFGAKTLRSKSIYTDSGYTDAVARDDTLNNKRMTNVFIGVTGVLAVGAATLKMIEIRKRRRNAQRPAVSLDFGSTIGVGGRF